MKREREPTEREWVDPKTGFFYRAHESGTGNLALQALVGIDTWETVRVTTRHARALRWFLSVVEGSKGDD